MDDVEQLVAGLYALHDNVYSHNKEARLSKLKEVIDKCSAAAAAVNSDKLSATERARIAYLQGRALDALPTHSPEAEECLTRSVKQDPSSAAAWNALAHVYWKKRDIAAAVACFEDSLRRAPNVEGHCGLSRVLRLLPPKAAGDIAANATRSVEQAKAAVALDVTSFKAWTALAVAYLSAFFAGAGSSGGRDAALLVKAVQGFKRAVSLEAAQVAPPRVVGTIEDAAALATAATAPAAPSPSSAVAAAAPGVPPAGEGFVVCGRDPDLHYNYAQALQFCEELTAARDEALAALAIDPTLPATEFIGNMETACKRIADAIAAKGYNRHIVKKAAALAALSLTPATAIAGRRLAAGIAELKPGPNAGIAIALRAVVPITKGDVPPAQALMVDASGAFVVLAAYHVGEETVSRWPSEKDEFVILDPTVKLVTLPKAAAAGGAGAAPDAQYAYTSLQVLDPSLLLRNGATVAPADSRQRATLSITTFDA